MDKKAIQFNASPDEILRQRQLTPEQLQAKQNMDRLKTGNVPLGGAPPVKIPPLDAEPIAGMTMQDQADILRNPSSPLSPLYEPEIAKVLPNKFATLPPEAQNHPGFRPGVGSAFAVNQPQLQGSAAQLGQGRPPLSDETVQGLQELVEFQKKAEQVQKEEAAKLEKAMSGNTATDRLQNDFKDLIDDSSWDMLNNPARRKRIEDSLPPMDVTELIVHGEIREIVKVRENLSYTYRSISGEEDLGIKHMMYGATGGDRYLLDKFSLMQLTIALVAVNGTVLPDHRKNGKFDETMFLQKFDSLTKMPIQLLADMAVNYVWFDNRVRSLFLGSTEALKNG
jgi:hypothetical protein